MTVHDLSCLSVPKLQEKMSLSMPSPRTVRRAVKSLKTPQSIVNPDDHADKDYAYLESFCTTLEEENPGSVAVCETSEDGAFRRCLWLFAAQATRCVRGGKRVFSIDAAFLKPDAHYHGQLFNVCGFDGNGRAVTIGYAVAPTEDKETYKWFLNHVKKLELLDGSVFGDVFDCAGTVIFSDRAKGLQTGVQEECPNSTHLACCFHLLENTRKRDPMLDKGTFWWVQAAHTEKEFTRRMDKWREKSKAAVEYLEKQTADGVLWVTYQYLQADVRTWGLRTSNLSEIVNARLLQIRNIPILALMVATSRQLSNDIVRAKKDAAAMSSEPGIVTPYAQRITSNVRQRTVGLHAHTFSNTECDVDRPRRHASTPDTVTMRRVVMPTPSVRADPDPHEHLERQGQAATEGDEVEAHPYGSCECAGPFLLGLYCEHAYTAERCLCLCL